MGEAKALRCSMAVMEWSMVASSTRGRVAQAEVEDSVGEGNLLSALERALDLVHGGDAVGFLAGDEVEVGRDVARPLGVGAVREVNGLVQDGADVVRAEPGGEFADMAGVVGVVEVVARGEDFDGAMRRQSARHPAGRGAGVVLEEDVGGESGCIVVKLVQQRSVGSGLLGVRVTGVEVGHQIGDFCFAGIVEVAEAWMTPARSSAERF